MFYSKICILTTQALSPNNKRHAGGARSLSLVVPHPGYNGTTKYYFKTPSPYSGRVGTFITDEVADRLGIKEL